MTQTKRVITVAPMPPEKSAYALARYSRSPDSIRESIDWVRTHDSQKFLEAWHHGESIGANPKAVGGGWTVDDCARW